MRSADIFCKVIDNYGDAAVCWRLARQLAAEHGWQPRLWIDRPQALADLLGRAGEAVDGRTLAGVAIHRWSADSGPPDPGDCVIEAFGCRMPAVTLAALARRAAPCVWLNLEYLSAERWATDCHLRDSPHPSLPLRCTFFIPGFDAAGGGLLREAGLFAARDAFRASTTARQALWTALGGAPQPGSLSVSLFCYPGDAARALLSHWALGGQAVTLYAHAGLADALALAEGTRGALTVRRHTFLEQDAYDRLLWATDLNFVRGEDSFLRAQWAARPFVWQAYPQEGGAQHAKLAAFLDRFLGGAEAPLGDTLRRWFAAWNGDAAAALPSAEEIAAWLPPWRALATAWCAALGRQQDLASRLARFVESRLQ